MMPFFKCRYLRPPPLTPFSSKKKPFRGVWKGNSQKRFNHIKIVEVGPRDGLQNESRVVTTAQKVELVQRLAAAGCRWIETGSYVSPKWVPAMADTPQVMQILKDWKMREQSAPNFSVLVPNTKGVEAALEAKEAIDEVAIFASASETFSQKNLNCSIAESMERFAKVSRQVQEEYPTWRLRGYVSCVVGCPYQGHVNPRDVAATVDALLQLGCHEVSLGDTIGVGTPGSVRRMLDAVLPVVSGPTDLAVHFHDTYGQALANILASIERDISTVDAAVGGLGGCPYAKGASGNVATEDVVYMLEGMGLDTGIDLDELVNAGMFASAIVERETQSKTARAIMATRAQI